MGGPQETVANTAERKDSAVHPVLAYVRQLTASVRSHLLVELERLQMAGEEVPGSDILLKQLRTEFRKSDSPEKAPDRDKSPERYFFQAAEPFLVNCTAERAFAGQISRGSLFTIWELIGDMLPAMKQDFEQGLRPAIAEQKAKDIEEKVAQFHTKVLKSLEIRLATPDGVDRLRKDLAKYTSSRAAYDDLVKLVVVIQGKDALSKFQSTLPKTINIFEGDVLKRIRKQLAACMESSTDAVPFALKAVSVRLKHPWQLIRLAIDVAASQKISDMLATRYAIVPSMVLDYLEERRHALGKAMKDNRLVMAQGILNEILNSEYALRRNVTLSDAPQWSARLDDIMKAVAADVHAEAARIPDNIEHVLVATLRRHDSLSRRLLLLCLRTLGSLREKRAPNVASPSTEAR